MPFYEDFGKDFHYYRETHRATEVTVAHLHPGYELGLYLHNAPQVATINGSEYELPFPTAILIAPFSLHQNAFDFREGEGPWERGIVFFGEELLCAYAPVFEGAGLGRSRIWRLHEAGVRHCQGILSAMSRYTLDSTEQKLLFALAFRYLISGEAGEEIPVAASDEGSDYIGEVIRYMSEHLADGLTAEGVASRFFISRSKLNKDFRKYTSTTFHQLLGEMKMKKAVYFLKNGNTDIRKIAIASGFENESYFYALFKKQMGTTPLQYAKGYQEKIRQNGSRHDPRIVNSEWGMTLDF
jgi:AraC-like DNA-binding protein